MLATPLCQPTASSPSDSLFLIPEDLLAHPTDLSLNLRRCMAPSLDFYEEDMTQVRPYT